MSQAGIWYSINIKGGQKHTKMYQIDSTEILKSLYLPPIADGVLWDAEKNDI